MKRAVLLVAGLVLMVTYFVGGSLSQGQVQIVASQNNPGVSFVSSTAYEASHIAKASAGTLYGVMGFNSNAAAQYIQCFNSATVPADTTVPTITPIYAAGLSNFSFGLVVPLYFSAGITCTNSSTGPTKTLGGTDVFFTILYK
jgi:hypothetical protein